MQFRLSALFFNIFFASFALATCSWPLDLWYEAVPVVYAFMYASAFVVAYHTTGHIRAFCFAFATFGIVIGWGCTLCPDPLAAWVKENFVHPTARDQLGEYHYSLVRILDCHMTFVVSLVAGAVSRFVSCKQSIARSLSDANLTPTQIETNKEQNNGMPMAESTAFLGGGCVLAIVLYASIVFASATAATVLWTQFLNVAYTAAYGTALVIGINESGIRRTECVTFAIFGLAIWLFYPFPSTVSRWLYEHVIYPDVPEYVLDWPAALHVMNSHIQCSIAIVASLVARAVGVNQSGLHTELRVSET